MSRDYLKMADILQAGTLGNAQLDILDLKDSDIGFRDKISGLCAGRYARLRINGETVMSETPMELRTNRHFIYCAYGDVLIGGLGIGLIVMAIQDAPDVRSITIIEKSPDVIKLVGSQLPINSKVRIIQGDVFEMKPTMKYDCVYMDIWNYVNSDVYDEMKVLKRKYGHYLKSKEESPKRFNLCWAEDYARTNSRLY